MEYVPRGSLSVINADKIEKMNLSVNEISELLMERVIINGQETINIQENNNPMDTQLDILYLTLEQVSNDQLQTIAIEFGQQVTPQIEKSEIKFSQFSFIQTIRLCLKIHNMDEDEWSNGILVLTNDRSNFAKQIYNSHSALAQAKKMGASLLHSKRSNKTAVYIDTDIRHRFQIENQSKKEENEPQFFVGTIDEMILKLNSEMNTIKSGLKTLKYKDLDTVIENVPRLMEQTDRFEEIICCVSSMANDLEKKKQAEIESLELKLTNAGQIREDLAEEREKQLSESQNSNDQYEKRHKQLIAESESMSTEHGHDYNELKEKIQKMKNSHDKSIEESQTKMHELRNKIDKVTSQNMINRDRFSETQTEMTEIKKKQEEIQRRKEFCEYSRYKTKMLQEKLRKQAKKEDRGIEREEIILDDSSSDDEQSVKPSTNSIIMAADNFVSNRTTTARVSTPSKYGMSQWNNVTSNIFQHLQTLQIGIDQATRQGVDEKQIQNLIILTLPASYQFVMDFITDDDRVSMDTFQNKIVELIEGNKTEQLSSFLRQRKNPNENVLAYFSRIKNLYKHVQTTTSTPLENDTFGIRLIYQKVFESMERVQASELQRLCEETMMKGTLKFSELLKNVAHASRRVTPPSLTWNAALTPLTYPDSHKPPAEAYYTDIKRTTDNLRNEEQGLQSTREDEEDIEWEATFDQ